MLNKEISERKAEKLRLEKAVDERTQELKEANEFTRREKQQNF
jgi:two-component system, chemotaxis family, CheB/CheR fusion protein